MGTEGGSGPSVAVRLTANTSDGVARQAALAALGRAVRTPTTLMSYVSRGAVLVLADSPEAVEMAGNLQSRGLTTVMVLLSRAAAAGREPHMRVRDDGVIVVEGELAEVLGHLGHFVIRLEGRSGPINLAKQLNLGREDVDLILDLHTPPALDREVLPPGYFAPQGDTVALDAALDQLPEMVGEFEKPKYFRYDPDICAHMASGIVGCRRCLDACPTDAIASIAARIEVDPYLCQGAGSCAAACPTGAITYAFPTVSDLLNDLQAALRAYVETGGQGAWLLFHDDQAGRADLAQGEIDLPEHVIPIEVEEVGSVGMDTWVSALAYGAQGVAWLETTKTPPSVAKELGRQAEIANALLQGMGYPNDRIRAIGGPLADTERLADLPLGVLAPAAEFAAFDEKRTMIRLALDHLYEHAPRPKKTASLPPGAPFGEIRVDRQACTLCMSCVAVCPASALADGQDFPQLRFTEANCVQCGLCAKACPEDAIRLLPQFTYDSDLRSRTRVLHEEEPFLCVSCGKPFATKSMMDRMQEKLKGHWMFQTPQALRRLQMCENCRVVNVYQEEHGGVHHKPDTAG